MCHCNPRLLYHKWEGTVLTLAAVSVGVEDVAVPAGALVHVVVDVEAELRARDTAVPAPACKRKKTRL